MKVRQTRRLFRPHFSLVCIYLVLASCLTATRAVAAPAILTGDNNILPNICQGAFGVAWAVPAIIAKAAPLTPTGASVKASAEPFAYIANLELKLCPPSITPPATVKKDPDATGTCSATFNQPLTAGQYSNWNGIPTSYLFEEAGVLGKTTWGELGRPLVFHFNTDVDVRLADPTKAKDAADDAWPPGNIVLPVGYNLLTWRANTMMDLTDVIPLFMIPLNAPGDAAVSKILKKSPKLSKAVSSGYESLTKFGAKGKVRKLISKMVIKKIKTGVGDLSEKAVEKILTLPPWSQWRTGALVGYDGASNEAYQEVWVYDTVPPTLQTNTDPSTFPELLQPLISYDPTTTTYYLEAFAPRIPDATVGAYAKMLLHAEDECQGQRPALNPERVDTPLRSAWLAGDRGTLQWGVADSGPNYLGLPNHSFLVDQQFEVRDSNPPILIAPPSQVVEIPVPSTSLDPNTATVALGAPRVFDLADLTPAIDNDAPLDFTFDAGINTVTWTATDASGNSASREQLINVKYEGTNTAPSGYDQEVSATSYEPVDIILQGFDADFDANSGRHDPLSFTIQDKPAHGFFIAPLLPYFINDYRLEASALRFAAEPEQVDPAKYCLDLQNGSVSGPSQFQMKYPYTADWFSVDDDGTTVVYDQGDMSCAFGDRESRYRMAVFDADGELLHNAVVSSTLKDIYIDHHTKGVYAIDNTDPGEPNNILYYDKQLNSLGNFNAVYIDSFGGSARLTGEAFITADSQGIVYVGGKGSGSNVVLAYQGPTSATELGSYTDYKFLGILHSDSNMRDIATDSDNNVYISKPDRILKFAASTLNDEGNLVPGAFLGWMGRCETNLDNSIYACDTVNHRSLGFSCTDSLCSTAGTNYGSDPAQFNDARGIAIDPHDILYVSDYGNSRVQRFMPEGDFAGQANSTGVGYGFILGDFGRPEEITVNSDHFYILNRNLLHALQTTPVTPIDDSSAKVTYQSDNNFVGTDSFSFEATDGLASGVGTITVNVERNYRPPEISVPPSYALNEDGTVDITLVGSDPDGVLDTLSYTLVEPPQHGTLSGVGANLVYTPDADYYGDDSFSYAVSDGVAESAPATVMLTIDAVEDPPRVTTEAAVAEGLGFTFQFPVEVFDPDADEALSVTIDWGDGSPSEHDGVIMQNNVVVSGDFIQDDGTLPADYEATGPLLNLAEDGNGSAVFAHAYTTLGDHVAQICVTDRVETLADGTKQATAGSQTTCTQTTFTVTLFSDLLLTLASAANQVDPGATQTYTLTVTNRPFDVEMPVDAPAGLDAANVIVSGESDSGLTLGQTSPSQGACTVDQGTYSCSLGDLPFGESATIEIEGSVGDLVPGNALLSMTSNRQADAVELLEEDAVGVVQINISGNPPKPLSLSTTSGPTDGGNTLTLTGQDFDADTTVLFDNLPASEVDVVDANTITFTVPAHLAGAVDVTVVNGDDQTETLTQAYLYTATTSQSSGGGGGGNLDGVSLLLLSLLPLLPRLRRYA